MSWYPQVGVGAIAQFPLTRSRQWRMITNDLESGETIAIADQHANAIGWTLAYQDLSNAEVLQFTNLFAASQGQAVSFNFVDPLANLLGWSEEFTNADWQTGALQSSAGISDPLGGQGAASLSNFSPGPLTVQQTVQMSGDYVGCFSVWVQATAKGSVVLQRDTAQTVVPVGTAWKRVFINGKGTAGANQSTFGVTLAAGQQVQLFGPQVEAQPYPSAYKQATAARGIYQKTYFASDELNIVSTGVGLSSCKITLISWF